jgi:predicted hydrocarbon binding protein
MSLLAQLKTPIPPPRLEGREVLVGPDPNIAKVKGVMFSGRKQLLGEIATPEEINTIFEKLSARTRGYVRNPLASSWCEFESVIELDRTIHNELKGRYPNVLALIGAASAELGIGRIYRSLDSGELYQSLENQALFHDQYQKFGSVKFERTPSGGRVVYSGYPCYSPVYCASAFGYFLEAILRHGGTSPSVTESRCQCKGDKTCTFELTWS